MVDPKVRISEVEEALLKFGEGFKESEMRNGGTEEDAENAAIRGIEWAREQGVYDLENHTISIPHKKEAE